MTPLAALALCAALAQPVPIRATPVPLDPRDPKRTVVGELELLSGLALTSTDRRFGGLSGMALDGDVLTFVSDHGWWLRAALLHDRDGRLTGLGPATLAPLADRLGQKLRGDAEDAEEIVRLADGAFLVTFEHEQRLLRYDARMTHPEPLPRPPGLEAAPANGGLEALVLLSDGRLLAVSEKLKAPGGTLRGWILSTDGSSKGTLTYAIVDELPPSGFTRLPDGDVLAVERKYRPGEGVTARFARLRAADVTPGATLAGREIARITGKMTADNFEGLAARRDAAGRTILYVVSDDNYASDQRTLLLQFALHRR